MAVQFLFDEHLIGLQWHAFVHRQLVHPDLAGTRIGDPLDLPRGTLDADVLQWAERENHILVSADVNTMPGHFAAHMASGHHSPGVFLVPRGRDLEEVLDYLVLVHMASDPDEWRDRLHWIPPVK